MSTSIDLRDVAKRRETECRIEAEAFDLWLSFLDKTNWITDILPAILSTIAGAAIFGLFLPQWDIWAGMAAFLSSALIVIHGKGVRFLFLDEIAMPTVRNIQGPYRLFFYSFDCDEPTHIHVQRENLVCKFWLRPISLSKNRGFSPRELTLIRRIIESNLPNILEAWHEHCG